MSLITRCPACATMFKVVPDQLRISEGWVRCGQCGEIFNASQNLVASESARSSVPADSSASASASASPPPPPAVWVKRETAGQGPAQTPAPESGAASRTAFDPAPPPPAAPQRGEFEQKVWDLAPVAADNGPGDAQAMGDAQELDDKPPWDSGSRHGDGQASDDRYAPIDDQTEATRSAGSQPGVSNWPDRPDMVIAPEEPVWADTTDPVVPPAAGSQGAAALATPANHAHDPDASTPGPTADDDEPPVSFMQGSRGNSFWSRTPVRLALAAVAVVLAAVLVAQILLQERNRVVLLEPGLRPVLQALCLVAGCELGALRQIESVVIDSSSFGRLRTDAYRLAFSLRNQAPIDVAMPAIELSLTDTQDQALIRRVILPAEFGAPTPVLAAGSDWSGTLALSIRPGANTERIAGYRLLAFYP